MSFIRLGTRASQLAMTQSQQVADLIAAASGTAVELVPIVSYGDVATGSLASLGGTGVFAAALREALLREECDVVVHSMKDLPTAPHPGLIVAASPSRERQNDVLCSASGATLAQLPPGARVGTGSPRRAAQVLRRRPDLVIGDIRGNIDTRLRKVRDAEFDAIVLAEAGLRRIGRDAEIAEVFPLEEWPTSAGQGALAVETRLADRGDALWQTLRRIADIPSETTALLERAVLAGLEAGCAAPVAVGATVAGERVALTAEVYEPGGGRALRAEAVVPLERVADDDGRRTVAADVVAELLDGGAAALAGLPERRS